MESVKECNIFASYVLFRELYDNNCRDIYDIIAEFVKEAIISSKKYRFTLTEITSIVNKYFCFNIPEYVIAPSIKRINNISKHHNIYIMSVKNENRNLLFEKTNINVTKQYDKIINDLYSYIENKTSITLNTSQKNKILNSFCVFLLEESNSHEYSDLISAFVISNKDDIIFMKQLSQIREGVVLYTGINYNNRINEVGTWKNEITIFLDLEILFNIAGYNGIVFNTLADELLTLIQDVKSDKQKKLIKLRFFKETKDEIEHFFSKAEYIVEGKDTLSPVNIAMGSIVNGCKTPADVIDKKSDFYNLLNNKGIIEDERQDYYSDNNVIYNLEDASTLEEFSTNNDYDDNYNSLKMISNINKLRKGKVKGDIEDSGYLLLTNTTKSLRMSKFLSTQNKTVPYAVSMSTLTNIFWFRLNKGFGAKNFPKSIDIITKAQIVLSKYVIDSIDVKYREVKEKYRNKEVTEDTIISRIAQLRNSARKPEDILKDDLDNALLSIAKDKITDYQEEHEAYKMKAIESDEKNSILEKEIKTLNNKVDQLMQENTKLQNNIEIKEKIKLKQEEFKKAIENKDLLINQFEKLDKKFNLKYRRFKILISSLIFLYLIIITGSIIKFGWDNMDVITYMVSLVLVLMGSVFMIWYGKSLKLHLFIDVYKEKLHKKVFKSCENISILIDDHELMIITLKEEINYLSNKIIVD